MSRDVEQRLQRAGEGFPGVGDGAGDLAGVVARGRRARTMGRALRAGMAGVLVAGTAVAAPGLLDRVADEPPPVVTGVDESVERDEVVDEAPEIEVTSPRDGAIVDDEAVEFAGTVSVGAEVTVGPFPVEVAPDGRWRITLELDEGENRLTFWATDRAGNRSFDTITVVRATPTAVGEFDEEADEGADEVVEEAEPAEPEPVVVPVRQEEPKAEPAPAPKEEPEPKPAPKEEPRHESASYAFTSNQKYGSCNEPVPYDEFWGKAKPGTQVWVYSEYGEKKVTVNGNGEWFARVEFPTAPQGKPFQVKTKSMHTGEKVFFEFVNTGEGGGHAEPVAWSAWQHESHVEWDPPYNYYQGTAPAGTVVEVASPYGDARTEADANGHWKTKVWFESAPYGTHSWTVVVESSNGDRNTFEFTGTRSEPKPEPKPEPEPQPTAQEVAFTSDQVHDVTDDDPPHSLYAGTATPGHKVVVFNEWGEGVTHADDNGNWSLWVQFPGAPRGQTIPVHVKHWETGEKHTYELQVI